MVNDAIHNALSSLQSELERLKKATDYIELSKHAGDKTIDAIAELQKKYHANLEELTNHYQQLGHNLTSTNQMHQSEIIQRIQTNIDASTKMFNSIDALKVASNQLIERLENPTFAQLFESMRSAFTTLEKENHILIAQMKGQEKELYESFLKYQQQIHQIYLKNTQDYFREIIENQKKMQSNVIENLHKFEVNICSIEQSIGYLEQRSKNNQKILLTLVILAIANIGAVIYLLIR